MSDSKTTKMRVSLLPPHRARHLIVGQFTAFMMLTDMPGCFLNKEFGKQFSRASAI